MGIFLLFPPTTTQQSKMSALTLPIGTYLNTGLTTVKWGVGSINSLPELMKNLRLASSTSKSSSPKALILTGKTLSTKTNVIKNVEKILGSHHAFTFTDIGEHAPVAGIERAVEVRTLRPNRDLESATIGKS